MNRRSIVTRLTGASVLVGAIVAVFAGAASAAAPIHFKQTLGPFVFDFATGTFCDFTYHEEVIDTQNIEVFFDAQGNLVDLHEQVNASITHQNVDAGLTLNETIHYAFDVDVITGEMTVRGQNWQLRNEDGRVVLVGAGRIIENVFTGEIFVETPNAKADLLRICTALGGALAP